MTPSQILDMLESQASFDRFCRVYFDHTPQEIIQGKINEVTFNNSLLFILWQSIFHRHCVFLVVSDSVTMRRQRAKEFKSLLERLPKEIYGKMVKHSTLERIELDNGCKIIFASGENAGKGFTICALAIDGSLQSAVQALYPCVATTGGTILKS